jgi:hypothetical protein
MNTIISLNSGLIAYQCPWQSLDQVRFTKMCLNCFETIYNTIFVTILILISHGWLYVKFNLSQTDITFIAIIMTVTYISYCVYSVLANQTYIEYWMSLYNLVILFYLSINLTRTYKYILMQFRQFEYDIGDE